MHGASARRRRVASGTLDVHWNGAGLFAARFSTARCIPLSPSHRGKKVFLVSWLRGEDAASTCPVWQAALPRKLGPKGLSCPIAVAIRQRRGNEAAGAMDQGGANSTYPSVIDPAGISSPELLRHGECAERGMDRRGKGKIRFAPSEPAGASDAFRKMDRTNFSIPRPMHSRNLQAKARPRILNADFAIWGRQRREEQIPLSR